MEIKVCDKCRKTNIDTLLPKLKNIFPDAKYKIGCTNMCGIGATKSFVVLDFLPVIAEDEDELIKKLLDIKKNQ